MTDKQIKEVFKNGFYCIEPCPEIKELQAELKRKEQECETLASQLDFEVQKKECLEQECEEKSWEIGNLGYKIKNQRKEINIRLEQLDQLKADREEALKQLEFVRTLNTVKEAEIRKLSKTLTEIKEIAEAHKKDESVWNPYRQLDKILQKISEVEDEQN